jgi:hypothetical protein
MAPRVPAPDCLGKIPERYCSRCSATCHLTALCVLIAMGDYHRQERRMPPRQELTDSP